LAVDIGAEAIDRTARFHQFLLDFVVIEGNKVSASSGIVNKVVVYIDGSIGVYPRAIKVGTFYKTNGDQFSCRDYEINKIVDAGYNEIDTNLDVEIDDYIGIMLPRDLALEFDAAGGTEYWYVQTSDINLSAEDCIHTAGAIVSIGGFITTMTLPAVTTNPATGIH